MKILTLIGTRPELIRLSVILKKLDKLCNHIIVYTNQNYEINLSLLFFEELSIRKPNYIFSQTSTGEFLGRGFIEFEKILNTEKPDKVLVLGDTNSGLLSILATKRGIPVYHMEAGNRCFDGHLPEELNRRLIDTASKYNLPYTENAKQNLLREGYHKNFVFKIGNPIREVLQYYDVQILSSSILSQLKLTVGYVLLTLHRAENVNHISCLQRIVEAINKIAEEVPVVYSFHPHTKDQLQKYGIKFSDKVRLIEPVGFFDFVKLEMGSTVILTDSGTVPEEASILHIPTIVLRNTTERQELMENGSLILAGTNTENILYAYQNIQEMKMDWDKLDDYSKLNVSDTVIRLLIGT